MSTDGGRRQPPKLALAPPRELSGYRLKPTATLCVLSFPLATPALSTRLTPAEQAVLICLLAGWSSHTIAARRGTCVRTVVNQIASLYKKLRVSSRVELVALLLAKDD